tara:strand:+ start:451 stop:1011 length:561 start_codon:yes stop_codon:yes gene_type:complete
MKPYHCLPCNNLKEIQQQVVAWIQSKNPAVLHSNSLWNKTDTVDLLRATPALIKYCESLDLKIREVALTIINQRRGANLHIDELPVTAKINIPILNTRNSFNRWYEISEKILSVTEPIINKFGKKYYNFKNIDYTTLKLLGEVELLTPVVFNSQIAHNIVMGEDCLFPRIVLACTFFNEPLHYLKN